jgi:hypothetical protein
MVFEVGFEEVSGVGKVNLPEYVGVKTHAKYLQKATRAVIK